MSICAMAVIRPADIFGTIKNKGEFKMQKIIDWFVKTTEDLKDFDAHMQEEIQRYANKQCKKAFIVGASIGAILGFILKAVVF